MLSIGKVKSSCSIVFWHIGLVLSYYNFLQNPFLHPYFVFFSLRSPAMQLEKNLYMDTKS